MKELGIYISVKTNAIVLNIKKKKIQTTTTKMTHFFMHQTNKKENDIFTATCFVRLPQY